MSDAAEVLGAILDSLALVPGGRPLLARQFEWRLHQFVACGNCGGRRSQETRHTQNIYTVSAAALRTQAADSPHDSACEKTLGRLLADIEASSLKSCDTDVGESSPKEARMLAVSGRIIHGSMGLILVLVLGTLLIYQAMPGEQRESLKVELLVGGCGKRQPVEQRLQHGASPARIFALQLCWECEQESAATIRDTLAGICEASHSKA